MVQEPGLPEMEKAALSSLPPDVRAYVRGGAAAETTLRRNRRVLCALALRPQMLTGVVEADTSLYLFGAPLSSPVLLAPVGLQRLIHPEGELAAARGAQAAGVPFIVSTVASVAIETIAAETSALLWFQLYAQRDWGLTCELVQRARAAGCRALVVTGDLPRLGVRDRQRRANVDLSRFEYPNLGGAALDLAALTWRDLERLRALIDVPLLLKGVLDGKDAARACAAGVDGVIVSNHGGRSLDGLPSTAEALPGVMEVVAGRIPVLVDGGIRRGTDVLKMLALGATAVLIGRPYLYGLHVGGAEGIRRTLELLRQELEAALVMIGRPSLASIDRSVLW